MHLKNNFPEYSWAIFVEAWRCWYCEMNTADCLHHIMGRGGPGSTCESSMLNAAPMCNQKCHLKNHGKISTDEYRKIFIQKTFDFLNSQEHKITETDLEFIKKYEEYFRRDQVALARKDINKQDIQRNALDSEKQDKRPVPDVHATVQKTYKVRRK